MEQKVRDILQKKKKEYMDDSVCIKLLLKTQTRNVGSMRPRGAIQSTFMSPTLRGIQEIIFLQDELE